MCIWWDTICFFGNYIIIVYLMQYCIGIKNILVTWFLLPRTVGRASITEELPPFFNILQFSQQRKKNKWCDWYILDAKTILHQMGYNFLFWKLHNHNLIWCRIVLASRIYQSHYLSSFTYWENCRCSKKYSALQKFDRIVLLPVLESRNHVTGTWSQDSSASNVI